MESYSIILDKWSAYLEGIKGRPQSSPKMSGYSPTGAKAVTIIEIQLYRLCMKFHFYSFKKRTK
jgi:hypothetical protein